ncbi:MAG: cobyrinate a,c-diamide synthase [Emergencia sp.]
MKFKVNRVMIAGTGSSCGKTTVTCALLAALKERKMNIASFKCGPDYIDPMFHSEIIGTKSRNLDLYLCGAETVRYLLAENSAGCDMAVVEGVMGMYDGLGFEDDSFSANHISRETFTPEILVAGVRGKSLSLLAEVSGYLNFRPNQVKGVILNNCSAGMYPAYKKMLEENLPVRVYGHLPQIREAEIGSRHLGLITAEEVDDLKAKVEALGEAALQSLDIEGICRLAESAPELCCTEIKVQAVTERPVKIGVARDKAFCFYYEDNFRLLEKLGAELIFFSPLEDSTVPQDVSGLIFGGGYPEEYLPQLSANTSMLQSIRDAAERGMPVYGECGGFMYLGDTIEKDGTVYRTAGVIRGNSRMTRGLVRFGYKTLKANRDNLLCRAGEEIRCHEFHYSDTDEHGDAFTASKASGKNWQTIKAEGNILAGYPHLHLYGNISFAENFVKKCDAFGGHEWKSSL